MAYRKQTIDQVDVAGRRVLMRVDFNVPLHNDGSVGDDTRIRAALPSIRSVLNRGGRLVLMSHLGRPKGEFDPKLSLKRVGDRLSELLGGTAVHFAGAVSGPPVRSVVESMQGGEIALLENTRFDPREKSGDASLAAELAPLGDVYCNDAFGACHRNDATMLALPQAMGDKPRVAGLLLDRELRILGDVLENPTRPFIAVLGGAKVSDKIGAITNLLGKVDAILIGGAMAYTLLHAKGVSVGACRVEPDRIDDARAILDAARAGSVLVLPSDHVCAREMRAGSETRDTEGQAIPEGWMGLDLGPQTVGAYSAKLRAARTIVWNGPLGVFEMPPFDRGSRTIAQAIVEGTEAGATSVVGGGDTAAAVEAFGLAGRMTHVSTGGGASLQVLEGRGFEPVDILDEA